MRTTRREFLKSVSAGAAGLALGACAHTQTAGAGKPLNVLMIAIDDMNNWVGALGGRAKTPNIDRLAHEGVLFTNAQCVVSCCNPSRTALMTGLRPETTGQFGNDGNFRNRPGGQDLVTLPQHFMRHGYETVGVGKLYHFSSGPKSDPASWNIQGPGGIGTRGVEQYLNDDGLAKWQQGKFTGYQGTAQVWGPCGQPKEETFDWQNADLCAQYLAQEHDKPFFLACGIFRPHAPLLAPQEYFDMYPIEDIVLPEVPPDDFDDIPACARANHMTKFFVEGVRAMGQWEKAIQAYLACMSFADACVGHLLDALDSSAYRDNTAVVLWTDHGWHLGDKERWEKFTLWRQSTNAPLIFKYPGMRTAGEKCERAVSFLDIYPTLNELCALPPRPELEGHSLVPLLKKPDRAWPYAAVNTHHWLPRYSVAKDQWHYIRYDDGSEELYDIKKDPMEFKKLAMDSCFEVVKHELEQWIPTPQTFPKWRTHEAMRDQITDDER